jgi:WhiB family redox-sensing transcriptional regulator
VIDMNWRHHAACRHEDPELFFPLSPATVTQAKTVCGECPVRAACLAYACATGQDAGIWGGMTEEERRVLLRSRLRARTATPVVPAPEAQDETRQQGERRERGDRRRP